MLNRLLLCGLALTLTIACDDGETTDIDAGDEAAGAETAGAETAGAETAGAETAGTGAAGAETAGDVAQTGDYEGFAARGLTFFAEVSCQSFFACAAEGRLANPGFEFLLNRHSSFETCVAELTNLFPSTGEAVSIEAGLINFDVDSATECLSEIEAINVESSSCDELLAVIENTPESCERATQGTVELGGACSSGEQCAGDASCELSGEMVCEIGVCVAGDSNEGSEGGTAMLGEACEDSEGCAGGLLCSSTTEVCAEASWHAEGEACELGGAKICNPGLVCQLDLMTFSQTCVPPIPMGGQCLFGPQCEIGLTCIGTNFENFMPGTCGALGEAGAACIGNYDCAEGFVCNVNGDSEPTCAETADECPLPMSSME